MKATPGFVLILALIASSVTRADMVSDLTARAEKGEAAAQIELAGLYSKGEAIAKDEGAAIKWLLKAAEQGDEKAQVLVGQKLLNGKDATEGIKWLTKAAELGNTEAQMTLGGIYIGGRGVRKNSTEAAKWFMMSAGAGSAAAQCQISRMHMTGAGVKKDDVEALKWANIAAAQGDIGAKKLALFIEQKMPREKVVEAMKLSREYIEAKKANGLPGALGKPPEDLPTDVVPVEPLPPVPDPE